MALQHPVPDEHLKHIGDITVSFALLESVLQHVAKYLLGTEQHIATVVTAELSFKALRAVTVSLYLQRYSADEDLEKFRALMTRAAQAEDRRNQITHSLWLGAVDPRSVTRHKTTAKERHGMKFQWEEISAAALAGFAHEIKALALDIQNFWAFSLVVPEKKWIGSRQE